MEQLAVFGAVSEVKKSLALARVSLAFQHHEIRAWTKLIVAAICDKGRQILNDADLTEPSGVIVCASHGDVCLIGERLLRVGLHDLARWEHRPLDQAVRRDLRMHSI